MIELKALPSKSVPNKDCQNHDFTDISVIKKSHGRTPWQFSVIPHEALLLR